MCRRARSRHQAPGRSSSSAAPATQSSEPSSATKTRRAPPPKAKPSSKASCRGDGGTQCRWDVRSTAACRTRNAKKARETFRLEPVPAVRPGRRTSPGLGDRRRYFRPRGCSPAGPAPSAPGTPSWCTNRKCTEAPWREGASELPMLAGRGSRDAPTGTKSRDQGPRLLQRLKREGPAVQALLL